MTDTRVLASVWRAGRWHRIIRLADFDKHRTMAQVWAAQDRQRQYLRDWRARQ
jgi:hypothetical protein